MFRTHGRRFRRGAGLGQVKIAAPRPLLVDHPPPQSNLFTHPHPSVTFSIQYGGLFALDAIL